jgi:eukaryotic-like serine/threonine-protein kinase
MGTAPKAPNAPEAPLAAVKPGDVVLDRYRVVEQIASGGHSVVFLGQDERLSRPVCIKVFSGFGRNSGVGRTSYEHFVQEAFALSRLTHPNTLRIYDFGHLGTKDSEGMPLQVCELMTGGTLSQRIREGGPQSLAETVRIVQAMCLALDEAHELGIVHRDIKPQNILFGSVGAARLPKLADFGIAKWSAEDDNRQQRAEDTAIVAGQKLAMYSPSWAAPEQLAGQPVSPATDIYSLACVAVYMLSTKAIFADEDVYAGYKKRRSAEELVAAALLPLGVPGSVISLLSRALAFDPKRRITRVEQLGTELVAALESAEPPRHHSPIELPLRAAPPLTAPPLSAPPLSAPPLPAPPLSAPPLPPPIAPPHAEPTPPPHAGQVPASSWAPAPAVHPWMTGAAPPQGRPRRLPLTDVPLGVGDRRVHFIHATGDVADLVGGHNTKLRVTFLSGPGGGRVLHVKGLTCFVAHLGGRPSPAVQVDQPGDIALVTPRAQEIGHVRIATGTPAMGESIFGLGAELITIAADDCTDPILFDFGPGSDAYFVYTRGRPIARARRT